jgi:hypothetical protein
VRGVCRELTAGQSVWLPLWRVMLITRNDLQLQFPRDTVDGEEAPMSMSMASLKRSDEVEVVVVVRRVWGQRK